MTTALPVPGADDLLKMNLDAAVATAGLSDPETERVLGGTERKRARRDLRAGSRLARVLLVQDEGVLHWEYDPPPTSSRRRARSGLAGGDADVVHGFQFREVPPNQVTQKLQELDARLTPSQHLRWWDGGTPKPVRRAAFKGPVLLLVHGTFSKGEMFFEELGAQGFAEGQAFLEKCRGKYEAILTFDHPTLSVGPWLNALDLALAMRGVEGPVDVICHSRGGLVTAWWLFHASPKVRRVVFVGSPLDGTSLASPARLKAALDLLGNFARALGTVAGATATAVPMLAMAGGLVKLLGGLISFGVRTPLLDAGVSLVPGLSSQSRVKNNLELQRLFALDWGKSIDLHSITSDYEPAAPDGPWWKFWKHFRRAPGELVDWGADAIFEGPNDLVVDTDSMIRLGDSRLISSTLDLSGHAVHHCAYFRQKKVVTFLADVLRV